MVTPDMLNELRSLYRVTTFDIPKSHTSTNKQLITKFHTLLLWVESACFENGGNKKGILNNTDEFH